MGVVARARRERCGTPRQGARVGEVREFFDERRQKDLLQSPVKRLEDDEHGERSMFFCLIVNPNILWAESVHVSCYANGLKHGFLDRIGPKSYADSAKLESWDLQWGKSSLLYTSDHCAILPPFIDLISLWRGQKAAKTGYYHPVLEQRSSQSSKIDSLRVDANMRGRSISPRAWVARTRPIRRETLWRSGAVVQDRCAGKN